MKKNILFIYSNNEFKKYIKNNFKDIFHQSYFLKKLDNFKNWENIEVISVFVDFKLTKDILEKFPYLKLVATRSTGIDHIDLKYCEDNNIEIKNIPDYGSRTVAEYALMHILSLSKISFLNNLPSEKNRGFDLQGKTIGIIGLGKIGKNLVKLLSGFNVKILATDPYADKIFIKENNVELVDLDILMSKSNILSIHAPLCKSTFHMLGNKEFKKVKDNFILVNTGRGAIINTKSLYKNLKNRKIYLAGLDVLENEHDLYQKRILNKKDREILSLNKKIIKMKNVFYTKHQAYNTYGAIERIWKKTGDNILDFLK